MRSPRVRTAATSIARRGYRVEFRQRSRDVLYGFEEPAVPGFMFDETGTVGRGEFGIRAGVECERLGCESPGVEE